MRKFAVKGVIVGLLLITAVSLFRSVWSDALFVLRHFMEIVTGEVQAPVMDSKAAIGIGVVLFGLAMLIGTIPRKDGSYIDEETKNDKK